MAELNNNNRVSTICICFFSLLIFADFVISADPLKISPNLDPGNEEDDDSSFSPPPSNLSPSPAPASSPSYHVSSPPSPSPLHSGSSPTHSPVSSPNPKKSPSPSPSPLDDDKSPVPSPSDASDINHIVSADTVLEGPKSSSSSGMTGLQKFGVTVGVVVGAGVVLVGGFVYKKRQDNIRRSRYAYAAGGDFL